MRKTLRGAAKRWLSVLLIVAILAGIAPGGIAAAMQERYVDTLTYELQEPESLPPLDDDYYYDIDESECGEEPDIDLPICNDEISLGSVLATDSYDKEIRPAAPGVEFFRETFAPVDETFDFTITADSGSNTVSIVRTPEPDPDDPGIITRPGRLEMNNLVRDIPRSRIVDPINIQVSNNTGNPVEFYLVSYNNYDDILMNFVESASEDEPFVILHGETKDVPLTLFAHMATRTTYNITIVAYIIADGVSVEDVVATLTLNVPHFNFSLNLNQTFFDPATLTRTFTIANTGDYIGDLVLTLEGDIANYAFILPGVDQAEINSGDSLTGIQVIPDLARFRDDAVERVEGQIVATAGGQVVSWYVYFDVEGQEITIITFEQLGLIQDGNPFHNLTIDHDSFESTVHEISHDVINFEAGIEFAYDGDKNTMPVEMTVNIVEYFGFPESFNEETNADILSGTLMVSMVRLLTEAEFVELLPDNLQVSRPPSQNRYYVMEIAFEVTSLEFDSAIQPFALPVLLIPMLIGAIGSAVATYTAVQTVLDFRDAGGVRCVLANVNYDLSEFIGWGFQSVAEGFFTAMSIGGRIGPIARIARNLNNRTRMQISDMQGCGGSRNAICLCVDGRPCAKGVTLRIEFNPPIRRSQTQRSLDNDILRVTASYRAISGHHNLYGERDTVAWFNGVNLGTMSMTVNNVFFLDLPVEHLRHGQPNEIFRQYHINYGQSAERRNMRIIVEYSPDTEIGFIGNPDSLIEVRSLPDLAVYPENIRTGNVNVVGETSEATIYFFNRGSMGTWAEIQVFINDQLVYTDSETSRENIEDGYFRYVAPFSEDSITIEWTPTSAANDIRVELTSLTRENIFPERHDDNNSAVATVTARTRQVPSIDALQPTELFIGAAWDNVAITASIANALDIERVYFTVNDGTPVQARLARVGASFENIRASAQLFIEPDDNEITVTVVYRTSRETTDYIEITETVTAHVPGQISFSIDTNTVVNPTFRLIGGVGSVIGDTTPGIFTLQKSPAMVANPAGFHLLTISDAGIIVTNLADLDGAELTLGDNHARKLTVTTGEATLNAVNVTSVWIDNVALPVSRNFVNPDMILFSDNVTQVFSSVSFGVEGFNHSFSGWVTLNPDGDIDLTSHFRAYRFVLPENHGHISNVINQFEIFTEQTWGNQSVWGINTAYDSSTRTLTTVILGSGPVNTINNAIAVFARIPVVNTLFEVDITDYDTPVKLDATGYSTISFELDPPGEFVITSVVVFPRVQGSRQNFRLWGQ